VSQDDGQCSAFSKFWLLQNACAFAQSVNFPKGEQSEGETGAQARWRQPENGWVGSLSGEARDEHAKETEMDQDV
jgi:hypothetical protein